MADKEKIRRYKENLQDEINAAFLYRKIAELEKQPQLVEVFGKMADVEIEHRHFWEKLLKDAGEKELPSEPDWRTKVLGWMTGKFGPNFILPTMISKERGGSESYQAQPEVANSSMVGQELFHERLLTSLGPQSQKGVEGGVLAQLEGRHRAGNGNALRAAVLGANDGLVSNLSLVMGVAGANLANRSILIAGISGLLAGAFSMALGEWLSVQSARELNQHQIAIETQEIEDAPEEEAQELALIYQAKGLSVDQAQALANQILSDKETSIDTLAREELGIDPDELGGSAWEASLTSFFLFALGAIVPLFPFFFLSGFTAIVVSLVASAVGMFFIGAAITVLTGKNALLAGMRQVAIGMVAAGLTFGLGRLINP